MTAYEDLRRDLAQPPDIVDIGTLLTLWRHDSYVVLCDRPHDLEEHPELPVRIRGAFGRALMAQGPLISGRTDPFARPRAFEALFGDFGIEGLARPYVIDVDVAGAHVAVCLKVFGDAMLWSRAAKDALVAALAEGVALKAGSRHRVTIPPREVSYQRVDGLELPAALASDADGRVDVVLQLLTPLSIRRGVALAISASSLAGAAVKRVSEMARWQGYRLVQPASNTPLEVDTSDTIPVSFRRHSRRQIGRSISMDGIVGRLVLRQVDREWLARLAICEIAHIGSHAGLGFGRFRMIAY